VVSMEFSFGFERIEWRECTIPPRRRQSPQAEIFDDKTGASMVKFGFSSIMALSEYT
jgi:hypothetical protein